MLTQENKCLVCLKLFTDPRSMPCKHIYCFKCIPHLYRRDIDTKNEIVLECRICSMKHSFPDWSTIKYYTTLHCVPYVKVLRLDKSSCSICFNVMDEEAKEYCRHCEKMICRECITDHRMELKKNILQNLNQCRLFLRRNQEYSQQIVNKFENMKIHIDFTAFELVDKIDTYCDLLVAQLDEHKFDEETPSSSGYESSIDQQHSDKDFDIKHQSTSLKNLILTEPTTVPVHLLGELISSDTNLLFSSSNSSVSQILWTLTCSSYPSHLAFEPESSKLFICSGRGHVSIYNYTTTSLSLTNTFSLQYKKEKSKPVIIKSLTTSKSSLFVLFNSSIKSFLHLYTHYGHLLHSLSFINEYISQIRFDNNSLWCLELISSSIFSLPVPSDHIVNDKTLFISFKQRTFNPYRFALNQNLVAIMDRSLTGIILLYNKHTTCLLKQILSPLNDIEPSDIELTNQLFIYRYPCFVLLTQIDNEQIIEKIHTNKCLNVTIGKSDREILLSTLTDDNKKANLMPLFTRDFVSCHAKPFESHLYNDPVMLICSHVFCRSCCLSLAEMSKDPSIICPLCSIRIPFDNLNRFANSLISHGTLAAMVKQYLREEHNYRICLSCQNNYINDPNEKLCEKCLIENKNLKKKIVQTMENCDKLISNQKTISSEKIYEAIEELYKLIDQRIKDFNNKIDRYQQERENLLTKQEKSNEMNALKHQSIDIKTVSELVEPRLEALQNNENFYENVCVEKEIKRLNDEADRQLRLLKHKSDIVPVLTQPIKQLSVNLLIGELLFKPFESESPLSSSSSSSLPSMINSSGDTSLLSIPPKLPMWTVSVKAVPIHLCLYPLGKSILIFSCSSNGLISLLTYTSPVTYDSPHYIRTFNLFPNQTRIHIRSFTVFNRFMLVHIQSKTDNGLVYFFTHDGILQHEPIKLSNPIKQYLADENRLWAIDSLTQTIFSHTQPLFTHEISSVLSKREIFIKFDPQDNFHPFRIAINNQLLGILSNDLQQVFIYNKLTRQRIFTSHFSAGNHMNVWDIKLFSRDNSLLLKFDLLFDGNVKRSLFIHFNTKNQSVGRIEGKHCLGVVIGPNKEILIGFNLSTGIIRCYM